MYTTSTAFLEALNEAGITYIFANFGSDHPALLEAIAEARANGRKIPQVVTAPNEMVGMSAAHGFAQVTGQPQLVLVHVECGTQALAGAVHNAARGHVPMLIFAGASPFTQDGEMKGSRNEFIQWIQDVHDQRGIIRGYTKYDAEIRTGENIKQVVHRALQFTSTDPKGPVYLMGAREVMEADIANPVTIEPRHWRPVDPGALTAGAIDRILDHVEKAKRPLLVTSYAGRNPDAVAELVRFCERVGMGVHESVPSALNIPHDHPLYLGNQWNEPYQDEALAEADFVLVVDSDVPWIPSHNKPTHGTPVIHIDVDPLKENMPLWYIGAEESVRADAQTAFAQLNAALDVRAPDAKAVKARSKHYAAASEKRRAGIAALEVQSEGLITPEFLTATVRRHIDPDNTIVLSEGITNYTVIANHMRMTQPGSYFASGGGSLGWNGGAAIGTKLAAPEKTVVALSGDGSYMFSIPSTVHWMAGKYQTPFLQVVYNNGGWKAPRFSALSVHPDGYASRANDLDLSFDPPPAYADIAAASGGAWARKVERPEDLDAAVAEALAVMRDEKRSAVLDVWLAPV